MRAIFAILMFMCMISSLISAYGGEMDHAIYTAIWAVFLNVILVKIRIDEK